MKPTTTSLSEKAQLRFQILEKIFSKLGEEQSQLILMYYRGHHPREMAKRMNISEPQLKKKLLAAKQEAKVFIKKHYR
jgi:DNA-directed RNA polymerase specialized sigma24 family protein